MTAVSKTEPATVSSIHTIAADRKEGHSRRGLAPVGAPPNWYAIFLHILSVNKTLWFLVNYIRECSILGHWVVIDPFS